MLFFIWFSIQFSHPIHFQLKLYWVTTDKSKVESKVWKLIENLMSADFQSTLWWNRDVTLTFPTHKKYWMGFINGKSVVNRIMLPPRQSTPINLPEQGDWKSDEKLHCVTAVTMSKGAITLTCIFYKLYMLHIMYKYMYVCLYLLKNKCKFLAFIHSFYPRTCSLCSYN